VDTLTTSQLLAKLNLKSPETLRRWREAGLIDGPTIEPVSSGRGRIAKWPANAFAQAIDVREKLKSGMTLEQIIAEKATKPATRRKYDYRTVSQKMDRDGFLLRLRDLVTSSLRQYSRQNLGALGSELVHEHHLKAAEAIERIGEHPVILVSDNTAVVRSVKDVGKCLEESQWPFAILAIIPVDLAALRQ
jgi:hypothetical protein